MSTRRTFLKQTAAVAATASLPAVAAEPPTRLVDCNITVGAWPFRFHRGQEVTNIPAECERLRARGLTQGWAGSFEGIFYRDVSEANALLFKRCSEYSNGLLLPIGTVNPVLPGWQDDIKRCTSEHGMRAIRLHPNYHGYSLDDPRFLELLELATEKKFLIQIVAQMEDERTQHPLMQVKPVDFKPLPAALKRVPEARIMVLNANRAMSMTALQGCNVTLDIAMLEGVGGVENLLKDWPLERLVFGSHAPLFYFESAKLKLQESELSETQLAAITHGNPDRLLAT